MCYFHQVLQLPQREHVHILTIGTVESPAKPERDEEDIGAGVYDW